MSLLFKILYIALKYKYKLIFINRISQYTSKISDIINMNIKKNLTIVKDNLNDEEIIKLYKYPTYIIILWAYQIEKRSYSIRWAKTKLVIARSLVQNTKIILVDEATIALENGNQKKIQDTINNIKNKYSILIVAHRLPTVINCKKIPLVEDGKISAKSTHNQRIIVPYIN